MRAFKRKKGFYSNEECLKHYGLNFTTLKNNSQCNL